MESVCVPHHAHELYKLFMAPRLQPGFSIICIPRYGRDHTDYGKTDHSDVEHEENHIVVTDLSIGCQS